MVSLYFLFFLSNQFLIFWVVVLVERGWVEIVISQLQRMRAFIENFYSGSEIFDKQFISLDDPINVSHSVPKLVSWRTGHLLLYLFHRALLIPMPVSESLTSKTLRVTLVDREALARTASLEWSDSTLASESQQVNWARLV